MDEFVKVTFPTRRQVYVDGNPCGFTNEPIQVQTGTHTFDLGAPRNYKTVRSNRQGKGHACAPAHDHRVSARMTARAWRASALAAFLAAGCVSFPVTERLDMYDSHKGYRYERLKANGNDDELFVVLTFSGGGTRAAAFSYGVLEELRETTVTINGEPRNLLKEVDLISSISGGSFTAAYYGLRGGEIFQDGGRFQRNFLYRDVQSELIGSLFNPYNWLRLASPEFGRIELATELYQELLFDDATFRDLERQARKPYLMINATDMTKGLGFTFVQPQFDPLCADLATVPIARAVAASSNFPIAFTPLTLNSYPGSCNYTEPPWVKNALNDLDINPRRY